MVIAPVADDAGWVESGHLVYGPRKAGTTLLQNLIDGGEELLAYPAELKVKYLARQILGAAAPKKYFAHARVQEVSSPHLDIATYTSLWEEAGRAGGRWPIRDLIRFDAEALAKSLDRTPARLAQWSAKEVGGRRQDVVAYWRRLFPGAKAVFIVREPHAILSAILRDRQRKEVRLSDRDVGWQTFDTLRTLRRQARYLADPAVHFVVYEDLVADPEAEMRKVAGFLGLSWSEVYTRPTLFGDPVVVRTASNRTAAVFRSEHDWREGLSADEQRAVERSMAWARRVPGRGVDYDSLRAAIADRAP